MALFEFKVVAGYNNAGTLANIEDITPSGDWRGFTVPDGFASYSPGQTKQRPDGIVYTTGYPTVTWRFGGITRKQYIYLRDTYCNDGLSGKVTIRTLKEDHTYGNFNAVMIVPQLPELTRRLGSYEDCDVRFIRLVAL